MSDRITLGCKCRNTLHGIEGIAMARTEYLTGCTRVCLEFVKEGELKEYWFDEPTLEVVDEKPKAKAPEKPEDNGGPGKVAPSRDCPRR